MRKVTDCIILTEKQRVKQFNKIMKENDRRMKNNDSLLIYPPEMFVEPEIQIIDKRDIKEFKRRMKKHTCQPLRNELYSVNPSFNGVYSDPQNR